MIAIMLVVMSIMQLFDIRDLRYQSDWFSRTEYWRVFSAHWVHFNWQHLLLNAVGLTLCMGIASPQWPMWKWVIYQLTIALGISLLFTLNNPQLQWYVGYSGVLFGVYLLAAVDLYSRDRIIALLLGSAISIKVILEQTSSLKITTSEFIGTPVVTDAHLYGLLLGLSIALVQVAYTIWSKRKRAGYQP